MTLIAVPAAGSLDEWFGDWSYFLRGELRSLSQKLTADQVPNDIPLCQLFCFVEQNSDRRLMDRIQGFEFLGRYSERSV